MKKLLLLVLIGCFDPGSAPLICSEAAPKCPDGTVCQLGQCVAEQVDAGNNDLATSDMAQAPDMLATSACVAGNGNPIGVKGAWICPGVFGGVNPKAAALCRVKVCSDSALISDIECASATGFFVSSVWGSTDMLDASIAICNSAIGYNLAFFGCGKLGFKTNTGCGGFLRSLQTSNANQLTCPNPYSLDKLVNTNPTNGVLCCP
jgi:hypothetical protein